jgi:SAM-dependent methyltransferase
MAIDSPNPHTTGPADRKTDTDPPGLNFGAYYYAHDCGIPYEHNEHWIAFFDAIARRIVSDLHPVTVLDAGCATGMLVEALRNHGVDASGVDVSEWAIEHVVPGAAGHCTQASLTQPLPNRYDLITCVEVIEHIPEPEAAKALENLCAATDRILISTSPFDYGEPTHVNVRPPEEWAARFASYGFVRDLGFDASFVTPWAALFRRATPSMPELVRDYERLANRLSTETNELRASALNLQNRLENEYGDQARSDLRQHATQLEQALLVERDRAVTLETQLGNALGQIRVLEDQNLRYQAAAHDLEVVQRSPVWRVLALYLKVRARLGRLLRRALRPPT